MCSERGTPSSTSYDPLTEETESMDAQPKSFWLDAATRDEYPSLASDRSFDVAVPGVTS
jgi:hypothetical protein